MYTKPFSTCPPPLYKHWAQVQKSHFQCLYQLVSGTSGVHSSFCSFSNQCLFQGIPASAYFQSCKSWKNYMKIMHILGNFCRRASRAGVFTYPRWFSSKNTPEMFLRTLASTCVLAPPPVYKHWRRARFHFQCLY